MSGIRNPVPQVVPGHVPPEGDCMPTVTPETITPTGRSGLSSFPGRPVKRVLVSPIFAKVQAARDAHVLEAIHYARPGHLLSSFRCGCGARRRTCNRDVTRGHSDLADLYSEHKNGPDMRGHGPRASGRLVAE